MKKKSFALNSATVQVLFNGSILHLPSIVQPERAVIITDKHVYAKHKNALSKYKTIVIPSGEPYKNQSSVNYIIQRLIELNADRNTFLIGLGGGVITDITGYIAGIFMRGLRFGFIPTSLLGMVDAAIGGKNGVDIGLYKNMVGLIRQPAFVLYDYALLQTLPKKEWINGFAEIIKHACILDKKMFALLQKHSLSYFQLDKEALAKLIERNVNLKMKIVAEDEWDNGNRRLLNFGHTVGHAIENLYSIPHGHAISIGMGFACRLSEQLTGFKETAKVCALLKQYGLPPQFELDRKAIGNLLYKDKKKVGKEINFILLQQIGHAKIENLEVDTLLSNL